MTAAIHWDLDPYIFEGFPYFRWYGLCWALGMIGAYQALKKMYLLENRSLKELDRMSFYLILGTILGARLGHVLFYDPVYYLQNPIEILPIRLHPTFQFTGFTGLASHGGTVGALISLYLYTRKSQKSYLYLLDHLIIAGAILGAFIRLGNFVNSEIIGTPTELPWAVVFSSIDATPRHPAQLYEALFYGAIGLLLYRIWRFTKWAQNPGFLFGLGMILIFAQRFAIEFLKEDQVAFEEGLHLNMGQILSIPMMLVGLVILLRKRKSITLKTHGNVSQ